MISACDLQFNFNLVIADLTRKQVINYDETGLHFCLLTQKTFASLFERRAERWKTVKIA